MLDVCRQPYRCPHLPCTHTDVTCQRADVPKAALHQSSEPYAERHGHYAVIVREMTGKLKNPSGLSTGKQGPGLEKMEFASL
jgi:hypothetical protein